jgi:hypothetical protein
MLNKILAIAGKPGLFQFVSRGNRMLIVETIDDAKKRMPAYATDQVVALSDISIYTNDGEEVSLASVLRSAKVKYEGKKVELSPKKASQAEIVEFFENVIPNYDTDRVHVSDMRKLLSWYNILIGAGLDDFSEKDEEVDEAVAEAKSEE